jgi:ankyrin repeat protein
MRAITMLVVLTTSSLALGQTEDDRKITDAWRFSSPATEASRERAAIALLDAEPALAKDRELFVDALGDSGVAGDLGRHGKQLAEAMIARGADVNGMFEDDEPLLIRYAMFAQLAPLQILLAHGAKPDIGDHDRRTGLHWLGTSGEDGRDKATTARTLAAAKLLLDAKANINAKDQRGSTPLHLAAFNGALALTELYLARGADINAVDASGYSVLGVCRLRVEPGKHGETFSNDKEKAATRRVIELLVAKGAKDIHPL